MNAPTTAKRISTIDAPAQQVPDGFDGTFWNSDTIAQLLRDIGLDYVAICPGSSFRGLHESLVNHLGNERPEMLLCLHEENAVAIAHGYARVTGKPMGVIVHCNVGLMHASHGGLQCLVRPHADPHPGRQRPARFRAPAHADRLAAQRRRPGRAGAQLREMGRRPLSPKAAVESILRGHQMASTAPKAPVYITLDQRLQEDSFAHARDAKPKAARFQAPTSPAADPQLIESAADLLLQARAPVILAGRVSRDEQAWAERVRLAEMLGARVLTDLKVAGAFPTDHPLHGPDPAIAFTPDEGVQILRNADVILSLDWWDQATLFKQAWGEADVPAKIIRCSIDTFIHRGWTRDHMGLTAVDIDILAEPDRAVPLLLRALDERADAAFRRAAAERVSACRASHKPPQPFRPVRGGAETIGLWDIGAALSEALGDKPYCLMRAPLGWHVGALPIHHPLDYLGADGAAGIGGAPGHVGRLGAGVARQRPVADRGVRRRRLPDGRFRPLDCGALPHSAADRDRQQCRLLHRRAAPGDHVAGAPAPDRNRAGRPAHRRSGSRHPGDGQGARLRWRRPGARSFATRAGARRRHRGRRSRPQLSDRCPHQAGLRGISAMTRR